jgi:hypothetical protein
VGYGNHQVDVPYAIASNLLFSDFNPTTVTYNTLVPYALIFSTGTFVIFYRTEYPFTEQTVSFRLVGAVIDGLRLEHFPL